MSRRRGRSRRPQRPPATPPVGDGVTSASLFLQACPDCTVSVEYRTVAGQWRTFVTHEAACPHVGEDLTPAGWGRIQ